MTWPFSFSAKYSFLIKFVFVRNPPGQPQYKTCYKVRGPYSPDSPDSHSVCGQAMRMLWWWSPAWHLIEKLTGDIIIEIAVTTHKAILLPSAGESWESSTELHLIGTKHVTLILPGSGESTMTQILSSRKGGERREYLMMIEHQTCIGIILPSLVKCQLDWRGGGIIIPQLTFLRIFCFAECCIGQ